MALTPLNAATEENSLSNNKIQLSSENRSPKLNPQTSAEKNIIAPTSSAGRKPAGGGPSCDRGT